MTRFARAKGSKASNERVFSEPTPWLEMKNQMLKRKQEIEEEKKRREAEAKRNANYQKFLNEKKKETKSETEWVEFPEDTESKHNGLSDKSRTIKKLKNKLIDKNLKKKAALVLETEVVTDLLESNNVSEGENKSRNANDNNIDHLGTEGRNRKKKKLRIIVDDETKSPDGEDKMSEVVISKKKKKTKKTDTFSQQNGKDSDVEETNNISVDNDAPIETSSKVEVLEPVVKKVKKNRKILKVRETEVEMNEKKIKNNAIKQKSKDIDFDSLPEEDKMKILKKQEKRRKQIERKKTNKLTPITEVPETDKRTPKKNKPLDGEFKRKKDFRPNKIMVNGNEVELEYFDGFPIKKEDARNLVKLKREMISKGLPRSEINRTLKLERRKAEKALAREKKKVCFNCRKFGHNLSDCPLLSNKDELVDTSGAGICFKCGSTEHTSFACRVVQGQNFKFATCFICKEQGHISRQCPDNARGLYPKGGSCRVCGDVTHLKKDCPQYQEQQRKEEAKFQVESIYEGNPEDMEPSKNISKSTTRPNIIKF